MKFWERCIQLETVKQDYFNYTSDVELSDEEYVSMIHARIMIVVYFKW